MKVLIVIIIIIIIILWWYSRKTTSQLNDQLEGYYVTPATKELIHRAAKSNNLDEVWWGLKANRYTTRDTRIDNQLQNRLTTLIRTNPLGAQVEPETVVEDLHIDMDIQTALLDSIQDGRKKQPRAEYFDRKVASDSQNVHDTQLGQELVEKYQTLGRLVRVNQPKSITEINNAVANNHKAKTAWNRFRDRNYISRLDSTDYDVLLKVWTRARDKGAVVSALEDCVGEHGPVCVTGRVARVIDSLTLLDEDEVLSKPLKTNDMYKKEIMSKAYQLLQSELSQQPEELVREYNEGGGDELAVKLQESITEKLTKEYSHLDHKWLDGVMDEVKMGI
jgi:hypothetical protein